MPSPRHKRPSKLFGHLAGLVIALPMSVAVADDWPQWMGPTRDGEYREKGLLDRFPEEGATILWRTPVAGGYAGPAVAGGRVFVTDFVRESGDAFNDPGKRATLAGKERVLCLEEGTGKVLWEYAYDCPYSISYPAGPRCTPTVAGNDVVTLGSEGDLFCFDIESGEVRWHISFKADLQAEVPLWGYSCHPLITDDLVICMVGGKDQTVVAFDRATGKPRWKSLSASAAGYCPPSLIEIAGTTQLVVFHADGIDGLDPATGNSHWNVPLKPAYEMAICRPQREGDLLYASGIGNQAVMLQLTDNPTKVNELWAGTPKTAVYGGNVTPILYDGVLYGSDCGLGAFIAADAKTGERLWESFEPTRKGETRRISHGSAFVTHLTETDRFLLFSELGDLILARLTREGYEEISRAHVIEPTGEAFGRGVVWSHPAYANRRAYLRNDKEIIAVSLESDSTDDN